MSASRAIRAVLEAEGVDITKLGADDCLYCFKEPGYCRICHGVGKLPRAVQGRVAPVTCENCRGTGKCPQCGGKTLKKKGKRLSA